MRDDEKDAIAHEVLTQVFALLEFSQPHIRILSVPGDPARRELTMHIQVEQRPPRLKSANDHQKKAAP